MKNEGPPMEAPGVSSPAKGLAMPPNLEVDAPVTSLVEGPRLADAVAMFNMLSLAAEADTAPLAPSFIGEVRWRL